MDVDYFTGVKKFTEYKWIVCSCPGDSKTFHTKCTLDIPKGYSIFRVSDNTLTWYKLAVCLEKINGHK